MRELGKYKTALVHDWFYTNGGAEKCIQSFLKVLPQSELYGLIDFLSEKDRQDVIGGRSVHTSFIQHLPTVQSNHRKFLPLFPLAVEQFDLAEYELVLSSSASIAKGVMTHANQLHVCYCHSPMRYAWDLYHQYLTEAKLTKGLKGWMAKYFLHQIRQWDVLSSPRVDHFIANSQYIAARIWRVYRRQADVIYPPVNTDDFSLEPNKQDYYFTASRMVPYKRMDLIVEAFSAMPDKKLVVIGDGPEFARIKQKASQNVELLGHQPFSVLRQYMQQAKAFVFAAEEDFGIIPVEAQACGTPVIAFGRGGVLETVIDGVSGSFFYRQDPQSIVQAVRVFDKQAGVFDPYMIRENALRFNKARFELEIQNYIEAKLADRQLIQRPSPSLVL